MDARELRRAMSRWATGVAVVTSRAGDVPRGATTTAFTSLSLEPPLVLVCLDRNSRTLAAIRDCGRFCVNVLAAGQADVARRFATKLSGEDKLAGTGHELVEGIPVLDGVALWLACSVEDDVAGGDHAILIGRPEGWGGDGTAEPLVFVRGEYAPVGT